MLFSFQALEFRSVELSDDKVTLNIPPNGMRSESYKFEVDSSSDEGSRLFCQTLKTYIDAVPRDIRTGSFLKQVCTRIGFSLVSFLNNFMLFP